MTIWMVQTYVVKPENQADLEVLLRNINKMMKDKPEKFKGLQSYKTFTHKVGSIGTYVEMYEFPDMGVFEKWYDGAFIDKDILKLYEDWMSQIVPESYTMHLWSPIIDYKAARCLVPK